MFWQHSGFTADLATIYCVCNTIYAMRFLQKSIFIFFTLTPDKAVAAVRCAHLAGSQALPEQGGRARPGLRGLRLRRQRPAGAI